MRSVDIERILRAPLKNRKSGSDMKLHFNPASPFARKVMVVAHECGIADKLSKSALALTPVKPDPQVNTDNPLGKIPALCLDDGSTLYDSRVIC